MSQRLSACAVIRAMLDVSRLPAVLAVVRDNASNGSLTQSPCRCEPPCIKALNEAVERDPAVADRVRDVEAQIYAAWEEGLGRQ
jgi:hypothetical protein